MSVRGLLSVGVAVVVAVAAVCVATTPRIGTTTAAEGTVEVRGVPVLPGWVSAGQNNHNTHHAATERVIDRGNVARLAPKWTFTTAGDVSATPTVVAGTLYVPDWGGKLWAIDTDDGRVIWSTSIPDYTGIPSDLSRTSPTYWRGDLFIGTNALTVPQSPSAHGAYLVSIDALTGRQRWKTLVDPDPATMVTSSPTVEDGVVYLGTSSKAETLSREPTFRGSVEAIDAGTGRILWKTYTIPEGYTGGAVWGSQPVVDSKRGLLYVGVGNNYSIPPGVCESPGQKGCQAPAPDNHIDAILGVDLRTGAIRWVTHTLTSDTWMIYQRNQSPDFDFGADPNLYTTVIDGKPTDLLGIGQKSGVYYALDPATGRIVWETQVGPGGPLGGILWGTATDGRHIFAGLGNGHHLPCPITAADGTKTVTKGGFFAALDAATGKIEWQTADPQSAPGNWLYDSFVTSANGVVYGGISAPTGPNMYALDAETGKILWKFASGGSVYDGAAVVDGTVYWGSGYHISNVGRGLTGHNNKLYAFTLNGR